LTAQKYAKVGEAADNTVFLAVAIRAAPLYAKDGIQEDRKLARC
jgi:hypothetical protein